MPVIRQKNDNRHCFVLFPPYSGTIYLHMRDFKISTPVGRMRYQFDFRSVQLPGEKKYFIRASNSIGELFHFEMVKNNDRQWVVVEPVPEWVREIESTLSRLIEQNNTD